jgi:hypothetical protein
MHAEYNAAANGIVTGLTAVLRKSCKLPERFVPLVNMGLGIAAGFVLHLALRHRPSSRGRRRPLLPGTQLGGQV